MDHGTTPPVLKVNLLDLLEGTKKSQVNNYSLWGVGVEDRI